VRNAQVGGKKRVTDWLYVLGKVRFIDEQLFRTLLLLFLDLIRQQRDVNRRSASRTPCILEECKGK